MDNVIVTGGGGGNGIEPDSAENTRQEDQRGQGENNPDVQGKTYTGADVEKLKAGYEEKMKLAVKEAEEKAGLKPDEKEAYEARKREEELSKREQELAQKQLKMETQDMLHKNGLEKDFTDFVISGSQEETEKRITAFKSLFDKSVQEQVEKRLAGKTPPAGTAANSTDSVRNEFKNALGRAN